MARSLFQTNDDRRFNTDHELALGVLRELCESRPGSIELSPLIKAARRKANRGTQEVEWVCL
ncbi:MAG: hypothetical protein CSA23_06240 [Deltaproteobacteria bacterium]|nr:MAG: hypothetical protein CSA23_06240 [Deltaproteobacteria bacterium]